ncbi:MAG: HDOD domain-containing protein [Pyrinomonadaceae bacterium]
MSLQISELPLESVAIKPKINIDLLVETNLPPSPGSIIRITKLLRDVNSSTRALTDAVSYEPMLVVRVLRLVNSPIYGLERNVTSIQTALQTIGNSVLSEIVMMELAASTFGKEIRNSIYARNIWVHSLAVAIVARELTKHLKMSGTEEAFTCGLLHDIGKFILLSNDFENFTLLLDDSGESEMLRCEQEQYGYNHAEIGSLVARRWGLQEDVCYSILHHHNPSQASQGMLMAHIIDIADMIANEKGYGLRKEEREKMLNSESVIKLNLSEDDIENIWNKVERNITEVIKTFV